MKEKKLRHVPKPSSDHPFRGEWGLTKKEKENREQSEAAKRRKEMLERFRKENTKKSDQQ